MKHQKYKKTDTWWSRFKRSFPIGMRWVKMNPEFTKKHPAKISDIFALK